MSAAMINGLVAVLNIILNMIQIIVIVSVIISWVGADPNNQIVMMVERITEPLYRPFRRLTRNIPGPFDWAPVCVLLIIVFFQAGLIPYLRLISQPSL